MALTPMLINLFPGAVVKLAAATDVAVLAGGLFVAVLGFVWLRRAQQTAEVRLEGASHGLGESSATFLARVLGLEGAHALVSDPKRRNVASASSRSSLQLSPCPSTQARSSDEMRRRPT